MIKELYGDLAWNDFNQVFKNHGDIVSQQFGKTLTVTLNVKKTLPANNSNARPTVKVSRVVKEDMIRKNTDLLLFSKQRPHSTKDDDLQLQNLDLSLKNLEKEFGKTSAEIAEIFCLVSGRLPKVREYLNFEKNKKENNNQGSQISHRSNSLMLDQSGCGVVTWSYLEDLALKKSEESPEFQVLIATKGLEEI